MSEHEGQSETPQEDVVVDPELGTEDTEGEKYDGGPIPPVESTEQEN